MSIKEMRTRNVAETFSIIEGLANTSREIVFRGHNESSYRLCSTLSRYQLMPANNMDLNEMLTHFAARLRAIGKLPPEIGSNLRSRLEYGRHYGVPSPLVDF